MQNFERCFHIRFIFQIKWSEKFNEINWNYVSGNKNQTWTFSQYFMGFSCWMSLIRFKHIEPYWFWTSQQTWQFSSLLFDTCLKNDFDIVFNFEIHLHIFHLKTLKLPNILVISIFRHLLLWKKIIRFQRNSMRQYVNKMSNIKFVQSGSNFAQFPKLKKLPMFNPLDCRNPKKLKIKN